MRVIFLSSYDPRDVTKWSGTITSVYNCLREQLGDVPFISGGYLDSVGRALNKVLSRPSRQMETRFTRLFARLAGFYVSLRLAFVRGDVIVAVAASSYLAYLITRRPIIYISDATFDAMTQLYPRFEAFPEWIKRNGEAVERRALRKADHVVYPSNWAAQSAMTQYGVPAGKITVIPFGPNLDTAHIPGEIERLPLDPQHEITLLYVSVDWKRKRGDLVIATCDVLRHRGIRCRAALVGQIPPSVADSPFVDKIGSINKSSSAGQAQLAALLASSTFMMIPTAAEAFGIVFSEAQAFGLPSITYRTGGTDTAVLDGVTGVTLPLTAGAEEFADSIEAIVRSPGTYMTMSDAARRRYETTANWGFWRDSLLQLGTRLCDLRTQRG